MASQIPSKRRARKRAESKLANALEYLDFCRDLLGPRGKRDPGFAVRARWEAPDIPEVVTTSFAAERMAELSGALGDPWVATPVQVDRLVWRNASGEQDLTVYNLGVGLLKIGGVEKTRLQRVHRFFETVCEATKTGTAESPETAAKRGGAAPSARARPRGNGRPKLPEVGPSHVVRVKATLLEIRPPIWRRLELPSNLTLAELHEVLQIAFGWLDCHLHQFEQGKKKWSVPDGEWPEEGALDERRVRVGELLRKKGDSLRYWYDFGDDWWHRLEVEEVLEPEPGVLYPRCTGGRRSGPPEDCGGPWGYANFLAIIADPKHPEHEETRAWVGEEFDPEAFDLAAVNGTLA